MKTTVAASMMCIIGWAEGPEPEPRYGHTCTYVDKQLFLIGGMGSNGQYLHNIHVLDTGTTISS